MDESKISLELSIREATILRDAIASSLPLKENEIIAMMLYNRLNSLIDAKKK